MPISTTTTLTSVLPEIDEGVFKELVKDLVSNTINGGDSPFSEVRSLLSDELANAVDLDANQKAGIYADFLKDAFAEVNKQSMNTALQILKTNEELKLQAYTTEANYNKTMQEFANLGLQETGLGLDNQIKEAQILESAEKVTNAKLTGLETLAKLHKQYGYPSATESGLGTAGTVGALDKQIAGYDKVNNKDVMKTMTEFGSMIYNAGDAVPAWVLNLMQDNAEAASGIAPDYTTVPISN